jgi:tRNA1(Val) A37 N6-methylase TrmN6
MTGSNIGEATDDRLLQGRLVLRQPARGHRAGTDAVLLAAAVRASAGSRIVDFGAGVGSVGLMIATRCPGCDITLLEVDPDLAALAAHNAEANRINARTIAGDVTGAVVEADYFDHVVMNPPFHPPGSQMPPDPRTARARVAPLGLAAAWIGAARRALRPGGVLTLIHRADALAELMASLQGFGTLVVTPVYPREGAAASRLLIAGIKNAKGPLTLERPLILNATSCAFTAEAQAVHDGMALERDWPVPRTRRAPVRPSDHQPR